MVDIYHNGNVPRTLSDMFSSNPIEQNKNHSLGQRSFEYKQRRFNTLVEFFTSIYLNRFKYKNAPTSLNTHLIESAFLNGAQGVAVGMYEGKLRVLGVVTASGKQDNPHIMPTMSNNMYDLMGGFNSFVPEADFNKLKQIDPVTLKGDYVIVVNKYSKIYSTGTYTDLMMIEQYADEIAEINTMSFDNMQSMRTTTVIKGKKGQIDKANFTNQLMSGVVVIPVSEKFELDDVQSFSLNPQNYQDDYAKKEDRKQSEFFMHIGINVNPAKDKKERLTVGEVEASNGATTLASNSYKSPREDAFNLLNKVFDTNIEVMFAYDDMTEITGLNREREQLKENEEETYDE